VRVIAGDAGAGAAGAPSRDDAVEIFSIRHIRKLMPDPYGRDPDGWLRENAFADAAARGENGRDLRRLRRRRRHFCGAAAWHLRTIAGLIR